MENELFLLEFHQLEKNAKTKSWLTAKRWLRDGIKVEACVFKDAGDFNGQIWSINPITSIDIKQHIIYTQNNGKYEIKGNFFYTTTSAIQKHVADKFLVYFFQTEDSSKRTRNWKKANKWINKNIDVDVCLWEENRHERGMYVIPATTVNVEDRSILKINEYGDPYLINVVGTCYCHF